MRSTQKWKVIYRGKQLAKLSLTLTLFLSPKNLEAQNFPTPQPLLTGKCAKEDFGCYNRSALIELAEAKAACQSFKDEAQACYQKTQSLLQTTPWYKSKVTFFLIGAIVGLGTTVAITQLK